MRFLAIFIIVTSFLSQAQDPMFVKIETCISQASSLSCKFSNLSRAIPTILGKQVMNSLMITKDKKKTYQIVFETAEKSYHFENLNLDEDSIEVLQGDFSYFNKKAYPFMKELIKTEPGVIKSQPVNNVGDKRIISGRIFVTIHEDNIDQPITLDFLWQSAKPSYRQEYEVPPRYEQEIQFNFKK